MTGKKNVFFAIVIIGAILLLWPDAGWAAPDAASSGGYLAGYENTEPRPSPVSWWSTLAYLFSLLAVFVLVVAMAYLAARILGGSFQKRMSATGGKVLESLPLGPKLSVCVVEMAGRIFLLGVTEQNIRLLTEITDEEEIERLHRQTLTSPLSTGVLGDQLGNLSDLVQRIPPLFGKK